MKRNKSIITPVLVFLGMLLPDKAARAQFGIGQLLGATVDKVIRAIDLEVQKAQNQTIWLQNAQKVIETQLNQLKLGQIASISQQQTDLFSNYYQDLLTVKTIINDYEAVKNITLRQEMLLKEYQSAWSLTRQDPHFTAAELSHISSVYSGILQQSVENLDRLAVLVNSFQTQMSDGARMELISRVSDDMDQNYNDLKQFNNENIILSLQRAKDQNDIQATKNLYGIL